MKITHNWTLQEGYCKNCGAMYRKTRDTTSVWVCSICGKRVLKVNYGHIRRNITLKKLVERSPFVLNLSVEAGKWRKLSKRLLKRVRKNAI